MEEPEDGPPSAEERLSAIRNALVTTTVDGRVTGWNDAAEHLFGWTADEARGQRSADLLDFTVLGPGREERMALLHAGDPCYINGVARRKDGSTCRVLVTYSPIRRDGRLIGIIHSCINLGIALVPMLELSTDVAVVVAPDRRITYATGTTADLFGWDPQTLTGTSVAELVFEEDRPALEEFLTVSATSGGHPPLELRVRHGRDWVWAEAAATALLDDPLVAGIVIRLRFAERRRAQEEAETALARMNAAFAGKVTIEQAKGYLAGRDGCTLAEAFDQMSSYAQDRQMSIPVVARQVLDGQALQPGQ